MQHLENDMDDLFHKAGNNYPLNTKGANWDSVKQGLYEADAAAPATNSNNYKRYSWLLLLLLVPFAWMYYKGDKITSASSSQKTIITDNKSGHQLKTPSVSGPAYERASQANDELITTGKSLSSDANRTKVSHINDIRQNNNIQSDKQKNGTNIKGVSSVALNRSARNALSTSSAVLTKRKQVIQNHPDHFSQTQHRLTPGDNNKNKSNSNDINDNDNANALVKDKSQSPIAHVNSGDSKKLTDQANPETKNTVSSIAKKAQKVNKPSRIYMGFILGPDLSWIGSQKVRNAGYTVGLNFGYRLDKHVSIEVAALYNRKKYYTDGKHFNKASAGIPSTVTLNQLDGGCTMIEFPLVVHYDFNIKKSSFFIAGGFSTYLMKNEYYDYNSTVNGWDYAGFKSYKNSGNYLFSNLDLRLGYNINLSPKTQFRIEPYLKIPVKGIGVGRMPVTSSGLYLGITRDLK